MLAAKYANEPDVVIEMLLRAGASVNLIGCERRTVLHYAASRGSAIAVLLRVGANSSIQDAEGNIALHYAALEGNTDAVQHLVVRNKEMVNSRNRQNQTPLHFAAINGNATTIDFLLKHNGDMRNADSHGKLPIWYSSYYGHTETVRIFILHLSPLGYIEKDGTHIQTDNPMRAAIEKRHFEVVKLLVLAGCDSTPVLKWLHDWSLESRDLYADHVTWLERHLYEPWPLFHMCRIVVRRSMQDGRDIDSLPLPALLKQCVRMHDV